MARNSKPSTSIQAPDLDAIAKQLASGSTGQSIKDDDGAGIDLDASPEELLRRHPLEPNPRDAPPISQDAPDLSDELQDALLAADAPEITQADVDFEPHYAKLRIRNPKRTEACRVFPRQRKADGTLEKFSFKTIKGVIPTKHGGTGRDEYYIMQSAALVAAQTHPTLKDAIKKIEFRLAITSTGEPFFIPDNLDDLTDWGPTKRYFLGRAERVWQVIAAVSGGWIGFDTEDYGEPHRPRQSARELMHLSLASLLVKDVDHPIFKYVKIKKAKDGNDRHD